MIYARYRFYDNDLNTYVYSNCEEHNSFKSYEAAKEDAAYTLLGIVDPTEYVSLEMTYTDDDGYEGLTFFDYATTDVSPDEIWDDILGRNVSVFHFVEVEELY